MDMRICPESAPSSLRRQVDRTAARPAGFRPVPGARQIGSRRSSARGAGPGPERAEAVPRRNQSESLAFHDPAQCFLRTGAPPPHGEDGARASRSGRAGSAPHQESEAALEDLRRLIWTLPAAVAGSAGARRRAGTRIRGGGRDLSRAGRHDESAGVASACKNSALDGWRRPGAGREVKLGNEPWRFRPIPIRRETRRAKPSEDLRCTVAATVWQRQSCVYPPPRWLNYGIAHS